MNEFKPNVSLEQLNASIPGDYDNQALLIYGRIVYSDDTTYLMDGTVKIPLYLSDTELSRLPNYAAIGLLAQWDSVTQTLTGGVIQRRYGAQISDMNSFKLPEVHFFTNNQKVAAVRFRARLIRAIQDYLDNRNFLMVQTPFLREAAEVACVEQGEVKSANNHTLYLRTDPEEYIKRYLTAGFDSVYEISTNFRLDYPDDRHLQEFTSLECYKRFWPFEEVLSFCSDLILETCLLVKGCTTVSVNGRNFDVSKPFAVLDFFELFENYADIDLKKFPSAQSLASEVRRRKWWDGFGGPEDHYKRTWIEWVFDEIVLPRIEAPAYVTGFPIELGLSYLQDPNDSSKCMRSELYFPGGFELAHLYENLTETIPLQERYTERMDYRIAKGLKLLDLDQGLMSSTAAGMPPMGGFALGVDRLLQIMLGSDKIGDGLLFPTESF